MSQARIPKEKSISIDDSLSKHVAWVFDTHYSKDYPFTHPDQPSPASNPEAKNIARYHHGIQHTTRAALYVPVWAHLYRLFGDPEAKLLTAEDLKLIQIGVLFHDSARQNDGIDLWDRDSALNFYNYLIANLNIDKEKAKFLAEAVANKDSTEETGYWHLENNSILKWTNKPWDGKKNIYAKLIHDSDCLDIIRVRDHFDGKYLDFYTQYAKDNMQALELLSQFRVEATSLIEKQGDSHDRTVPHIKKMYESEEGYDQQLGLIHENKSNYPLFLSFFHEKEFFTQEALLQRLEKLLYFSPYNPNAELTEQNLMSAIREGRVLIRSLPNPSCARKKQKEPIEEDKLESIAMLEIRKAKRRIGIPTQTTKPNNMTKNGNLARSTSLMGFGAVPYSQAGMLIVGFDLKDIVKFSSRDCNSGFLKKKEYINQKKNSIETITQQFNKFIQTIKLGGSSIRFGKNLSTHNEVLYNITRFDAIYFSHDPNLTNRLHSLSPYPTHPTIPPLEAIYLQNAYEKRHGKLLPIFEYSGTHNFVSEKNYSDEEIVEMWTSLCRSYIEQEFKAGNIAKIATSTLDTLKADSMYKSLKHHYMAYKQPADIYYNDTLKGKVNAAIENMRRQLLTAQQTRVRERIENDIQKSGIFLNNEIFSTLLSSADLCIQFKDNIFKLSQELIKYDPNLANWQIEKSDNRLSSFQLDQEKFSHQQYWMRVYELLSLIPDGDSEKNNLINQIQLCMFRNRNSTDTTNKYRYLVNLHAVAQWFKLEGTELFFKEIAKKFLSSFPSLNEIKPNQISTKSKASEIKTYLNKISLIKEYLRIVIYCKDNNLLEDDQVLLISHNIQVIPSILSVDLPLPGEEWRQDILECAEKLGMTQVERREMALKLIIDNKNYKFSIGIGNSKEKYTGQLVAKRIGQYLLQKDLEEILLNHINCPPSYECYQTLMLVIQDVMNGIPTQPFEQNGFVQDYLKKVALQFLEVTKEKLKKSASHNNSFFNIFSFEISEIKNYFNLTKLCHVSDRDKKEMFLIWLSKISLPFKGDVMEKAFAIPNGILLPDLLPLLEDKEFYTLFVNHIIVLPEEQSQYAKWLMGVQDLLLEHRASQVFEEEEKEQKSIYHSLDSNIFNNARPNKLPKIDTEIHYHPQTPKQK